MLKTIQNLTKAFIWESQARNRYTFFSKQASKEWYDQISEIFNLTANQELEHATELYKMIIWLRTKTWEDFKAIKVEAEATIVFGTTLENLKSAIEWEAHEEISMYPEFVKVSEDEWLNDIALKLKSIIIAERHHKERYSKLAKELENWSLFKKEENITRACRKCWYLHTWKEPLKKCPLCWHDQSYAEVLNENY